MDQKTNLPPSKGYVQKQLWPSVALSLLAGAVLTCAVVFGLQSRRADSARQSDGSQSASTIVTDFQQLAQQVRECMRASRPVLLGSRDPSGPSCVTVISRGDVRGAAPTNSGDLNGGPGTTIATLYYFDRQNLKTPLTDFHWHQTRLRQFLENELTSNEKPSAAARELARQALAYSQRLEQCTAWPEELKPIGFGEGDEWPSYCVAALDRAIAARDLPQLKHWASELSAACFALADLHDWLGFLAENQLAAIEFQKKCETLFVAADPFNAKYDPQSTISQFPAGVLSLNGMGNYFEVERQAEQLFSMPAGRVDELTFNRHLTSGSMWVPPDVRPSFIKVRGVLTTQNQSTFDRAARTPFEHSYLVNMLYRAWQTDAATELCESMRRFDGLNPNATITELMGAMMYRGHSFAGLEWTDRYLPELMDAARQIQGSDEQAFLAACQWTNRFYRDQAVYGVTLTLRDAIEQRRLDCVRATDMIGSIFRNAGRTRFGHVRWCAETAGHSVAAYFGRTSDGQANVLLADGMNPPEQLEHWPDAYFHGHFWPAGFEQHPTPYAVELYARGIDNYIWTEGYIVRGANAGQLQKARVPYFTHRRESGSQKVFDGPYPQ